LYNDTLHRVSLCIQLILHIVFYENTVYIFMILTTKYDIFTEQDP